MRVRLLLGLIGVATAMACSEAAKPAEIKLDREPVQLPAAYVGTRQQQTLQVVNAGGEALTVTSAKLYEPDGGTLDPEGAFTAAEFSPALPASLAPLEAGFVRFTFAPKEPGQYAAKLVIESDDPARPKLETAVTACAAAVDGGC